MYDDYENNNNTKNINVSNTGKNNNTKTSSNKYSNNRNPNIGKFQLRIDSVDDESTTAPTSASNSREDLIEGDNSEVAATAKLGTVGLHFPSK